MFFQVEAEACTWVALMYLPGRRRAANLLLQCEAWVCPPPIQLLLSLLSWQCDACLQTCDSRKAECMCSHRA